MIKAFVVALTAIFSLSFFTVVHASETNASIFVMPEVAIEASLSEAFAEAITAEVARLVRYPEVSRRWEVEGTTTLRVSYHSSGAVQAEVEKTSGSAALDAAALYAAKGVDPKRIFGPEFQGSGSLFYVIPVRFELTGKRS